MTHYKLCVNALIFTHINLQLSISTSSDSFLYKLPHLTQFVMQKLLPYLVFLLLSQCKQDKKSNEFQEIKESFSPETINYFYETAFRMNTNDKRSTVQKWKNDVAVSLEGNLLKNDSADVAAALRELNQIGLPVKIALTDNPLIANIRIFFGNKIYVQEKLGVDQMSEKHNPIIVNWREDIRHVSIGVVDTIVNSQLSDNVDVATIRRSNIIKDLTKSLGIFGDSWNVYHSRFYVGDNATATLSDIDKNVLHLLYHSSIPDNLDRADFETYFGDILYAVDSELKLMYYVQENKIPISRLEFIRDHCFIDSTLKRFPKEVFLNFQGEEEENLTFWKNAIANLNNITGQNLKLAIGSHPLSSHVPSIDILYNNSDIKEIDIKTNMTFYPKLFTGRMKGEIRFPEKSDPHLKNKLNNKAFNSLYCLLAFNNGKLEVGDVNDQGNIRWKPEFREILSLIYNPIIPQGFTLQQMDALIASCKKQKKDNL